MFFLYFIDVSPGNRCQASSGNRTQGGKSTLKINYLLNYSSVYSKLSKKSNPITKITADVNKYVWNLSKNQKITKAEYHFLHCSKGVIPRFYGLPKVHKVPVPLRPIVLLSICLRTICQNFYLVFCLAY